MEKNGTPMPATPELDMNLMHRHYGVKEIIENLSPTLLNEFIQFRIGCLYEEMQEINDAHEQCDDDGVVDGIVDLVVFAIGTLELMNVDFAEAWWRVFEANMNKKLGIKESRPNPFGLPDLVKGPDFVSPQHKDNIGLLETAYA
jgi:predicted HAD superfamily Cof-like phosphohydrolase